MTEGELSYFTLMDNLDYIKSLLKIEVIGANRQPTWKDKLKLVIILLIVGIILFVAIRLGLKFGVGI